LQEVQSESQTQISELQAINDRLAQNTQNAIDSALSSFESKKLQYYRHEYEAIVFANELLIQQTNDQIESLRNDNETWSYVTCLLARAIRVVVAPMTDKHTTRRCVVVSGL
jgi:hypothetical protein